MLKRTAVALWHMSAVILFGIFSMYYFPPIINDHPNVGLVGLVATVVVLVGWGFYAEESVNGGD